MKKSILTICFLLAGSNCFATNSQSYSLPLMRDGKTITRVAHLGWSGEYPGPVINVSGKPGKYTAIKAFRSVRTLDESVKCQIKNGIYHPWSKTPNSIINYYSLTAKNEIEARRATKLSGHALAAGERVVNIHYLGEGFCLGTAGKDEIEFECNDAASDAFLRITADDEFYEQWLYVKCREGYNAFVQDKSLLAQPGVRKGQIPAYGKVAP